MADTGTPLGKLGWLEHHSSNSKASSEFYAAFGGWPMEATDMDGHEDFSAMEGEHSFFGIIQAYPGLETFTGWLPYFQVEDITGAIAKVESLGATVVIPVKNYGTYGDIATFKDPQGAVFALWQKPSPE